MQRLKIVWQKYPLVSLFVFVLFIGCSICTILTYRIFYDLTHDFSAHVKGDLRYELDGKGSFGGGCNPTRTRCRRYYISLKDPDIGSITFNLPADLHTGTYNLQPDFEITSHNEASAEVSLYDEVGIGYIFDNEHVISGHIIIKRLPGECYDEIRGEFEVRLSKSGRFGTHKRTVDIEITGDFDFDPYVYYDHQGLPVYCEPPFAW